MTGVSGGMKRIWRRGYIEILVCLICATAALLAASLNHDSAYVLVAARRLLQGERLYVDLIETNPPLIFWLMSVGAAVGEVLALSDARLVGLFTSAMLWISAALGVFVLARVPEPSRLLRSGIVGSYVTTVVLLFLTQVGQREQLAAILLFPYSVLAARVASGHSSPTVLGVSCGVLAGFGIAIKPFFVAPWIAMEVAVLVMQGKRSVVRPEVGATALIQCMYLAAVLAVNAEYFTVIVPLVSEWYGAYATDRLALFKSTQVITLTVIGMGALALPRWLPNGMAAACARIFGAATLGWLVSYLVQAKGWPYHLTPAEVSAATALTALGVAGWGTAQAWWFRRGAKRLQVALVASSAALVVLWLSPTLAEVTGRLREVSERRHQYPDWYADMVETVEQRAAGEPVYVMSTSVWPAFPLVNLARAQWPYRYHFLWPIPALYAGPRGAAYRSPGHQAPMERQFFDAVVADLVRTPPRLLIVGSGVAQQAMHGRLFDFVEYFSGSPEFRTLFQRYERLSDIATWEIYEFRKEGDD